MRAALPVVTFVIGFLLFCNLAAYAAGMQPYGTAPLNPNAKEPYGTAPTNPYARPLDGLASSPKGYAPAHHPKDFVLETAKHECSDQITANADPDKPGSGKPDPAAINSCLRSRGFKPPSDVMRNMHGGQENMPSDPMLTTHTY